MLTPRYRPATRRDVESSDTAPGSLRTRLLGSFLILGCGVFALVYLARSVAAAAVVSGILFSLSLYSILAHHRSMHRLQRRLAEPEPVEMLDVRAKRVLDVAAPGSTGPALCFELPDNQVLLLYGQWLLEPALYRAPRPADDCHPTHFNALDAPHAFPSDDFTLHRWRGDARPFWIEIGGRYLPPENSPVELRGAAIIGSAEVFPGSAATLQSDIDQAFGHNPPS
jgi:hypothetical protein